MLRGIAGTFVLASLALGHYVDARWYWFTAFVGANLLQSGFTNWCPMMTFLRKLGIRDVGAMAQAIGRSETDRDTAAGPPTSCVSRAKI